MSIVLATLVINELEHLEKLYAQHRSFPGLTRWVFTESADRVYAETNPHLVTSGGLSVDGTTEFLLRLAESDPRVTYLPFGLSRHRDPAQGKCEARNCYLQVADEVKPDFVYVLDADESHTHAAQQRIVETMASSPTRWTAFRFKQRQIWRPPSIADQPLFQFEAVGGFWDIPHVRGWRWKPGMRYLTNHNTPEVDGHKLDSMLLKFDQKAGTPECVHLGFASSLKSRAAKHQYYAQRGESLDPKRSWYVESRFAWERWRPGDALPRGAKVVPFDGEVPEVFRDQ